MGGAVAMVAMASVHPPAADGLILVAPAVWARDTMPWYQRALLAVLASTVPSLRLTGEGLEIQASDNIEILRGLGRDPLVIKATRVDAIAGVADLMDEAQRDAGRLCGPILVLYGGKDQVIPEAPIRLMLGKLPKDGKNRIAFYKDGYHMLLRDLHAERIWADIAGWIGNRGGALPPGTDQGNLLAAAK